MKRAFVLALLLWLSGALAPASGAPFRPGETFDTEAAAQELTLALAFMQPRILESLPVSQLTLWGLRGLTTLDPRLRVEAEGGILDLAISAPDGGRLLAAAPLPADQDAPAWGQAAAVLMHVGWNSSQAVRGIGFVGVLHTFFDEVFDHLDPYSRYVAPDEAAEGIPEQPDGRVRVQRVAGLTVLHIAAFTPETAASLDRAVRAAASPRRHAPRSRGLVLDLRDNRGGLLDTAAEAAGVLLPAGVVAATVGRDRRADHLFLAAGFVEAVAGAPIVVLVNGRTASAAEIVAAALADQHQAVVVGSATLGKGLVQTVLPLPDGGTLFVTWSRVVAPLGWPLQGLGVMPQVCTSLGETAARAQLRALAAGAQPMARALARNRSARAPVPAAEALEIRSACPAAEGQDVDLEAARFLIDHPNAYGTALLGPPPPSAGRPAQDLAQPGAP